MSDFDFMRERRGFLGGAAAMAAALGLGPLSTAQAAEGGAGPAAVGGGTDFTRWLDGISGKYRQLFDAPEINDGMPLVWAHVLRMTGAPAYGVAESDIGVVVVLRHSAIPIALADSAWAKYKLGERYKVTDPATKAPATRNPFAHIKPGDLPFPEAALERLLDSGVKIGACALAIQHLSAHVAQQMGLDAAAVKQDWLAAVLPGVQVVPAGVLAVNGAQSRGCTYCFAG